jgi:hypothetical protein
MYGNSGGHRYPPCLQMAVPNKDRNFLPQLRRWPALSPVFLASVQGWPKLVQAMSIKM